VAHTVDTLEYWQSFLLTLRDLERIEERFFEGGTPLSQTELADIVIQGRLADAAAEKRRDMDQNIRQYQPKLTFEVGQRVRFPALNNTTGAVEAIRPGDNPAYGAYNVIRVRMERGTIREFAADYPAAHILNMDEAPKTNPNAIASVGGVVKVLVQRLAQTPEYVSFNELWFRKDLLPQVHIGHLNIAEAMIDLAGEAQTTPALVKEIELIDGELATRVFALNYALAHDPERRFVNSGTSATPRWTLRQGGAT
jgi:hypothetical protein